MKKICFVLVVILVLAMGSSAFAYDSGIKSWSTNEAKTYQSTVTYNKTTGSNYAVGFRHRGKVHNNTGEKGIYVIYANIRNNVYRGPFSVSTSLSAYATNTFTNLGAGTYLGEIRSRSVNLDLSGNYQIYC